MAEEFSVQQVLTEHSIEALDVGVLPRSARLDEPSFGTQGGQVALDGLCDKLRPIVTADESLYAAFGHQAVESGNHVGGGDRAASFKIW